jgi:hypothetical protein
MTTVPITVHDSDLDDGYTKGDDVDPAREPGNGAIVMALYRGYHGHPDYEKVWRREDLNPGQTDGNWFEIRTRSALCTHCGTTRQLGPAGPSSWGEVLGLDDPEPYGIGQVVLWLGGKNAFFW